MKLAYIRWLDACYQEGEQDLATLDSRMELVYCGWLVKETPEAVTLALEYPHEGRTRHPFSILRRNIVEMRVRKVDGIFRKKRGID